ncbi:MAG: hypothetical protein HZB51_13555 [Chloroflexi bacterium]|nr:hypothetical protein [Chloroflexota bacterium]
MLRLGHYTLGLVLWLTFFYNIERLDVNKAEFINVSSQVYLLTMILLVLGIILPQRFPTNQWAMFFVGLVGLLAIKLSQNRPYWGGQYTYITLFEFGSVFLTLILALRVGRLIADFTETVRVLIFPDLEGRVFPSNRANSMIERELQYARRRNTPLTIMLLEADTESTRLTLSVTTQEIQTLIARRYRLAAVTRLLTRDLRRSDLILDQTGDGRLILVTPETRPTEVSPLLERLTNRAQSRLGITVKWGVATFPEQGLTYEELVHQAEQDLRSQQGKRGKAQIVAATTGTTSDSAQVDKPPHEVSEERKVSSLSHMES